MQAGGAVVVCLLAVAGCDIPKRPVLSEQPRPPSADAANQTMPTMEVPVFEPPAPTFPGRWETWNAYFTGGVHVGYGHVLADRAVSETGGASSDASSDVRYMIDDRQLLRNGQATICQRLTHRSTETEAGQLKQFAATLRVGPVVTQFRGNVESGQLTILTQRSADTVEQVIAWEPLYRGFVAVEQSLRRTPIAVGDVRSLQMLLPVQHRVATVRIFCGGRASIPLLGNETRDLVESTSRLFVGEVPVSDMVLWTDEAGVTQKSYTPSLGLVTFRTDEATAKSNIDTDPSVDTGAAILVKGRIERPAYAKRTAFLLQPVNLESQKIQPPQKVVLAPAPGQFQRAIDGGALQLLVSSEPTDAPSGFVGSQLDVTPADSAPSPLIDFNAELVRRIRSAASVSGASPRETALEMTRTVNQVIQKSTELVGVPKASEVARAGNADSTGHAVLLTALLRASQIPARVVVGIATDDSGEQAMRYHAWTIAHVDGQWLALDATLGKTPPSNRIALLVSDFSGSNIDQLLLNVLVQLGHLRIEILKSKY